LRTADDKDWGSARSAVGAGLGVVHSGAVAGFPLPVLRYVVGAAAGEGSGGQTGNELALVLSREGATVSRDSALTVSWIGDRRAAFYRVEFETSDGLRVFA